MTMVYVLGKLNGVLHVYICTLLGSMACIFYYRNGIITSYSIDSTAVSYSNDFGQTETVTETVTATVTVIGYG